MNRRALLIASLLVFTVLLSACGGGKAPKDFSTHSSAQGLVPEHFIPADVGFMFSYSLKEDGQFAAVNAMEEKLGDDGRVSRTISEQLNSQLSESGLNYEEDLAPAFGEQFRLVFGAQSTTEDADAFSVVTLENPALMKDTLDRLSDEGELEFKKLSKVEAWVSEEDQFFAGIHDDLLLVANSAENLIAMVNQDSAESLWAAEIYQEGLGQMGSDYLLYGMIFPGQLTQDLDLPTSLAGTDIPDVIERQSLVVRAEEDGFDFDVYIQADKEVADANGFSFDQAPRSKAYMFSEVPAEGLMAYFESFGLQQTFEQAAELDSLDAISSLDDTFQNYFGMNFTEDVLKFMDKGFAIALHGNSTGIVPGVSLIVDVSSDTEAADEFLTQLDLQLNSLLGLLELALPGAVTKDTTTLDGVEFDRLTIDLDSVQGFNTSHAPLPSSVTSSVLQLSYGLMDDKLLITTAEVWEDGSEDSIADSDLYAALSPKLDGVNEGLILLDADGLGDFAESLRALREQLQLDISAESIAIEELFDGFMGLISASETKAYESHFGGFLMLAE